MADKPAKKHIRGDIVKPRKHYYDSYSAETWATLRGLYESGRYKSVEELQKHCKKTLRECPSVSAIQKVMQQALEKGDPWNKHESDEAITESTRESYIRLFEKYDMNREKRVQLVIEGILAKSDLGKRVVEFLEKTGAKLNDLQKEALLQIAPDLSARNRFLQMANDLLGEKQPERVKFDGQIKKQKFDPDSMTIEEMEAERERLRRQRETIESGGE